MNIVNRTSNQRRVLSRATLSLTPCFSWVWPSEPNVCNRFNSFSAFLESFPRIFRSISSTRPLGISPCLYFSTLPWSRTLASCLLALALLTLELGRAAAGDMTLLNVSYDPTREVFADYNTNFAKYWLQKTGDKVTINQSHGGSGKQARMVIDGMEADVVTLALGYDIDAIASKSGIIPANWQSRLPFNSSPYTSTIIFLVRKGNPRHIKDWDDLVKAGVAVITPNPKTSGSARWNYLAAWGFEWRRSGGDEARAKDFVRRLFKNVPMLDTGARGATTTFVERGIGDVLINWENEILLAANDLAKDKFEIVAPPSSIQTEPVVSIVDRVVKKRGTEAVAKAYLERLYSDEGQEIFARHYYRPRSETVLKKYSDRFPQIELFTLSQIIGDWQKAQKIHFADGGIYDQIQQANR
jgi:sulfate/thiosulfate-binding protein